MTEAPSSASVPVCYRHPSRETYIRCVRCDRPICPSCMHPASVGHQCPECVAAGRRTQRPIRTAFGGTRAGVHLYVTRALIAINCAMMIASALSSSNPGAALIGGRGLGFAGSTPLSDQLSVWGEAVYRSGVVTAQPVIDGHLYTLIPGGTYYRLFTGMFIHYGLLHLAFNMYALWVVGQPLEAMLGPIRFTALYLLCGLGGNVACYVFSPSVQSAGASTALFGLFGALFIFYRKLNLNIGAIGTAIVINLVFTFTFPGISIPGHIGGLLTGLVVGFGFAHAKQQWRTQAQIAISVAVLAILVIATVLQTNSINSAVT